MTLEEKIRTIKEPAITKLPTGRANTIEEFFENFVKDRLPKSDVIKHWHKLLMDYTSDTSNLSCCVRFGNNGNKTPSSRGETNYYKLRRGWLTRNNSDDFEYFFADNYFSSFIYKLAFDGYKPSLQEFGDLFRSHKFPYGYGFMVDKQYNEYKGVVVATASEPGFLGNYKLSHVFDAGTCYNVNGANLGDAELSEVYYPIGHSNDFLKNSDHIRRMDISDDAKKVIVAKFLRFAHPINYFLTPAVKKHYCEAHVYKNDIGEDPKMIAYVKKYLETNYPTEYYDFVSKTLWYNGSAPSGVTGKEVIDISYGLDIKKPRAPAPATNVASASRKRVFYSFDGNKYNNRRLVLAVVKKYVEENPAVTLPQMNEAFNIVLQFNKKPLIRLLSELNAEEVRSKRVFVDDAIRLSDGNVVVVNTQVSNVDLPGFIAIAAKLGYNISTT